MPVILEAKNFLTLVQRRDFLDVNSCEVTAQDFLSHWQKYQGFSKAGMSSATDYLSLNNQPIEHSTTYSEEDEVRRMEWEWGEAFERKDVATLDRMMADEYILTDPLGNVRSKAESLAALKSNEVNFESTKSDDVSVRINGDTAVVTGRSTFRGRYKGWSMSGQYQYTDILVKRRGEWKAVGSHITALGTGPLRLRFGRLVCDWLF